MTKPDRLVGLLVMMAMEDRDYLRRSENSEDIDLPIDDPSFAAGWMMGYLSALVDELPARFEEVKEALETRYTP